MSTQEKLLPCPFCGGEGEITPHVHALALKAVVCDQCSSSSGWYLHEEEAIAAWNRRTPPAAVPDGWVMVPREPTSEMTAAATNAVVLGCDEDGNPVFIEVNEARNCYGAMISAAPAAPTEASDE